MIKFDYSPLRSLFTVTVEIEDMEKGGKTLESFHVAVASDSLAAVELASKEFVEYQGHGRFRPTIKEAKYLGRVYTK